MGRPGSPRPIRWRKGEIIGAGAYGRVYMGMNLDSGELLAVKQVLISINNVAKEKAQAHIQELEEEVRLLRNLSHPNIVRYLGTAREEEALNILLEFVPGGSIASLLGKFGSFTEPVIRMYTKQLLIGLEYLHSNNILHRDIKGANILVDNKGCIKLADFGASKKVVELATISEAKSMKGTPYWMAPEVIRQTGHNWQADIWSVGCTVIEMATGKPPWSNLQEVAALFHIGTTKSHPPIPDHLSVQGKNFLLKCLQRDPRLRLSAAELSKHPFVTQRMSEGAEGRKSSVGRSGCLGSESHQTGGPRTSTYNISRNRSFRPGEQLSFLPKCQTSMKSFNAGQTQMGPLQESGRQLRGEMSYGAEPNCSVRLGSVTSEFPNRSVRLGSLSDEPCSVRIDSLRSERWPSAHVGRPQSIKGVRMDSLRDEPCSVRIDSLRSERWPSARVGGPQSIKGDDFLTQSFNPMSEPSFNDCEGGTLRTMDGERKGDTGEENEVGASEGQQDDDEEVTESKIRAFLDDKAQELRHLQTPLYEEFNNIWNSGNENHRPNEGSFLAPLSPAPSPGRGRGPAFPCNSKSPTSKGSFSGGRSVGVRSSRDSEASVTSDSPIGGGTHPTNSVFSPLLEVPSPRLNEWKGLLNDANHMIPPPSPSVNSAERQRLWKEELQQELEMKREEKRKLTRQASTLSNTTQSPNKEKSIARHASRLSGTPPTPR